MKEKTFVCHLKEQFPFSGIKRNISSRNGSDATWVMAKIRIENV